MAINAPLELAAQKLLSPRAQLSPFFFNSEGEMFEDKRLTVLKIVNFILERTLNEISGIIIEDICLVGSLASLYYHEDSDIDILVFVKNESCPYLHQDTSKFFSFTRKISIEMFPRDAMSLNNIPMDVILKTGGIELNTDRFTNIYSVLNNTWVRYNNPKDFPDITVSTLIHAYYKKLSEINSVLKNIKIKKNSYTTEQASELIFYCTSLIEEMKNSSWLSNRTYKLLRSQNKIQNLGSIAAVALRNSFTQEKGE